MFKTDQKAIARFAAKSPKNTARVIEFVLVSIRRNFAQVEHHMTGEMPINGLMGTTSRGIQYAKDNALELHALINDPHMTLRDKLLGVCAVPGLGIPKAGFVLQLCLGQAGCLDTHNLREFSLKASAFSLTKSVAGNQRKAQVYLDCIEKLGGSEFLWDFWCRFIADRHKGLWKSAQAVSKSHVRAIVK